jgi:hypothetical protein
VSRGDLEEVQEAMGNTVKEGEYAYLHYAHWTGGGRISHSVREWITLMTVGLERNVDAGIRAEYPS